jgi:hypothetical protein
LRPHIAKLQSLTATVEDVKTSGVAMMVAVYGGKTGERTPWRHEICCIPPNGQHTVGQQKPSAVNATADATRRGKQLRNLALCKTDTSLVPRMPSAPVSAEHKVIAWLKCNDCDLIAENQIEAHSVISDK